MLPHFLPQRLHFEPFYRTPTSDSDNAYAGTYVALDVYFLRLSGSFCVRASPGPPGASPSDGSASILPHITSYYIVISGRLSA